jgi:hypothetical protein
MTRSSATYTSKYKGHGSLWTAIRNRCYAKFVLHTDGPSYVHRLGIKERVEIWSWDEKGLATYLRFCERSELAKMLREMRQKKKVVNHDQATNKKIVLPSSLDLLVPWRSRPW